MSGRMNKNIWLSRANIIFHQRVADPDDVLDDLEYPHKLNCRDGQVKCYDPQYDDLAEFKKVWY